MAPYKQPVSLLDLSMARVSHLVRHTCARIAKRHPTSQPARLAAASELGGYLRAHIRPLLCEVCTRTFTEGEVLERIYGCIAQPPKSEMRSGNAALEVMLAAFVHPQMSTLHCRCDRVCSSHFTNLTGLIKLDLGSLVNVQEPLLEVIGRQCTRLEIIAFNFRVSTLHAIGQLRSIKTLRVIKDTSQRCMLDRQKYHLDFIRNMLRELPKLEHITCRCIGAVLDGLTEGQSLALKDVREKNPVQELDAIARLCPHLERLTLGSYSKSGPLLKCDFSPLTNSATVRISSLLLSCFSFSDTIAEFFLNKGRYLKSLFLRDCFELKVENVKTIGRNCPLLEKLDICRYNGIFDDVPINHYSPNTSNERIFENLLDLSCNGLGLLPLCLAHARRIKTILVIWLHLSRSVESEIGTALSDLIALNPMVELQSLGLYALDIVLSKELIQYFYNLPNIVNVTLCYLKSEPEVNELMHELKKDIVRNNLNLHLEYKFSVDSDDEGEEYYL